jgi:hypothetical protein
LRKLKDDSTTCVRVRRSSDNTEQDIGFDGSDNIDSSALELFAEGSQAFVVIWYNQLGGTVHLAQPTTSLQPSITDGSGVTLTDATNGKAYMDFSATSYLDFTETEGTYTSSSGWSVLAQSLTGDYGVYFLGESQRTTGFGSILSADTNNDKVDLYDDRIQYYVNGTSDIRTFCSEK